ncbi:hypothetical protein [Pectobacterium brasiliense]|uniref:hypothetical protein n=1 Tax=Pectobacterium brasiliense TaxID=180957 RepID=UPI000C1C43BB|nr:hypothetical protein [Pectobacterium brasiliense]ATV43089.1 hypothetical protein CTV95_06270 [Pectobacterium brasiliense]MCA6981356.1 hypothetical protein [Pectobacterium brasiliense]MCH4990918.1 hypothetical protein [Pectobacterium brasiliense]
MNNKAFIRTLLVDSKSKQFIKSLDERSLDSYIELLSKDNKIDNKNQVTIIDFSPVIEHLHIAIESAIKKHKDEEMMIHHATTYNNWLRFKDIPSNKEDIISNQAMKIMDDTERTINSVIANLSKLNYYLTTENEKDNIINTVIDNSAIFIESILCQIHAGLIFEPSMIQKSITIPRHLTSVLSALQDLLRKEAGINPDLSLHHDNIIEQACIEKNIGIDPHLIITLTNAKFSVEYVINEILNSPIEDKPNYGNNLEHRAWLLTWAKASPRKIERSILISEKMKKIISITNLFNKIKNGDYDFSRDQTDVENLALQLKNLSDNS